MTVGISEEVREWRGECVTQGDVPEELSKEVTVQPSVNNYNTIIPYSDDHHDTIHTFLI